MPKIDVLTVKLTCHIPLDPGSVASVQFAASVAEGLRDAGEKLGQTSIETRLNRVSAPEPEPDNTEFVDDRANTEPAAAE